MEDGTFQMHLHMMSGINHRNVRVLAVDAQWNIRAWIKVCYLLMMDLSQLSPKGGDLRTLLSDTRVGGSNIFEVTHTYLQRATGSLRENGSLSPTARDLNLHLPRNYADWLVKKQGYMTIHPHASEELRLPWCSRASVFTDSLCWRDSPQPHADCKQKWDKRSYEEI